MSFDLPARRGYADTPWGQLHYIEQGVGQPLLLLHQTPRSSDEFAELLPLLRHSARAISMDMLGFGTSAPVPGQMSIEVLAEGAFALLDALGIDEAIVLGHHTGGAVAIEMAASRPDRVSGLVLSSAPWTDATYREHHAGGSGVDEAEVSESGDHLTSLWAQRQPFYPAARPDLLNRFVRDALAPGVDPAEGHMACARYVMEDRIGRVTAPTLIVAGAEDPFAMAAVEPLRAGLVHAPVMGTHAIEGGHVALMEHRTSEVAALVIDFIDQGARGE